MKTGSKTRARTLSIEHLEPRQVMAAGVTASLSAGVLQVLGTNGDDKIVFHRNAGTISIDGVNDTWQAGDINSVQVDLGRGNDYVSIRRLDGIDVEVTAGGGEERARLADARDVYFDKLGSQLETASGSVTLDSHALDWFDTHVPDGAVRNFAKGKFGDQRLDRNEMIAMFGEVADKGKISRREMDSLRVLVKKDSVFGNLLYVKVLSRDVVLGNRANRHYQGEKLGNLKVGSSGEHLENLVNKWFLGKDRPSTTVKNLDSTETFRYEKASGELFIGKAKYSDVIQGKVGDCYLLASLAETARRQNSRITKMFIDNKDGTFTVRFFHGKQAQFITVDRYLPMQNNGTFAFANANRSLGDESNRLWVALAEKAYAQINESGWLRSAKDGGGKNSYAGINVGNSARALQQITSLRAANVQVSSHKVSFANFVKAYRANSLIVFGSKNTPRHPRVSGFHAYAVLSYNASRRTITLFNPWGVNIGGEKPGIVRLSWKQIQGSFSVYARTR